MDGDHVCVCLSVYLLYIKSIPNSYIDGGRAFSSHDRDLSSVLLSFLAEKESYNRNLGEAGEERGIFLWNP